jgi:hypothetical protein
MGKGAAARDNLGRFFLVVTHSNCIAKVHERNIDGTLAYGGRLLTPSDNSSRPPFLKLSVQRPGFLFLLGC